MIEVKLSYLREMKNTYRYDAEDAKRAAVTALYIKKSALSKPAPQYIILTIEEEA